MMRWRVIFWMVMTAGVWVAGGAAADEVIDFDTQVMAVLTKSGCNAGACHGAAIGRGGFRLSLYGGNPSADFEAIVYQRRGRRINPAHPDQSLLLLKPGGHLDHGGGYRLQDDGYEILHDWIGQGASRKPTRRLVSLRVRPERYVGRVGEVVPLQATAHFSDNTRVDVTPWTIWKADDESSLAIDADASTAELKRRGRHVVVARFLNQVVPLALMVPMSDVPVAFTKDDRHNVIDDHVLKTLAMLRIPISPPADDATWLRRLRLDLTGRLPSLQEIESFLASERPEKRNAKIDELLQSDDFTDYWTFQLARLLRIRPQPQDKKPAQVYHRWLRDQIKRATPYDQLARQLLTGNGDTTTIGPANFYRTVQGAREQAEFVSELFMGSRLRCANCHNHPLDRWTQDDYHGLAAIFARVRSGPTVSLASSGEVTHPRTGEPARMRIPGQQFLDVQGDPRMELADWITQPDNPYFAKAMVNRLWKAMLGRGLIEPSDDMRATNPPTHPELLDYLVRDFIENGYHLRHTLRTIAASATYARSHQPVGVNRADDRYYSHALERTLGAEVRADALAQVTGVAEEYPGFPPGTRAITLYDVSVPSTTLDILGRCDRQDSCETMPGEMAGGLSQKLHLANGALINNKIRHKSGRLQAMWEAGNPPQEIVDRFYRLGLSRPPTAREREYWKKQFVASLSPEEQLQRLEDFVWSLLNCREFATNH